MYVWGWVCLCCVGWDEVVFQDDWRSTPKLFVVINLFQNIINLWDFKLTNN